MKQHAETVLDHFMKIFTLGLAVFIKWFITLNILLSAKEYCKVIFPYEAQNDDELTIREGDVVTLISKVNAIFFSYKQGSSF